MGGTTLHSFTGIGIPKRPKDFEKMWKHKERLRNHRARAVGDVLGSSVGDAVGLVVGSSVSWHVASKHASHAPPSGKAVALQHAAHTLHPDGADASHSWNHSPNATVVFRFGASWLPET